MFTNVTCKASSEGNVWKYVFSNETHIAEAVLYRYNSFKERTVICCSVQSGCPVGCTFCGTGSKFVGNLTASQIFQQVQYILMDKGINSHKCEKFQIMFMSMGEPMLNWNTVEDAIEIFAHEFKNAQLLISTVGINNCRVKSRMFDIASKYDKVGLQFSIHRGFDEERNKLIPYENKLTLRQLRDFGTLWANTTKRQVYLNYCVNEENTSEAELNRLMDLFPPYDFAFTFSVICSKDETMKEAGFRNLEFIQNISNKFLENGYNVRVFNPAGQDDIGGGCGQLFHVQKFLKEH
jgi:23S rRNA (adenine2503-C2)-methyltransferase